MDESTEKDVAAPSGAGPGQEEAVLRRHLSALDCALERALDLLEQGSVQAAMALLADLRAGLVAQMHQLDDEASGLPERKWHEHAHEKVDEASWESFPASDAPAY